MTTTPTSGVRPPLAHLGSRPPLVPPAKGGRRTHRRWALTAVTWTGVAVVFTAAAFAGGAGDVLSLFAAVSLLPFLTTRTDPEPRRRLDQPDPIDDYMPAWWYLP